MPLACGLWATGKRRKVRRKTDNGEQGNATEGRTMATATDKATEVLDCGHTPTQGVPMTTGYGTDKDGKRHCFACCAKRDKASMRETGKATLYLKRSDFLLPVGGYHFTGEGTVSNWPGTLEYPCTIRRGCHNIAGTRYDCWFTDSDGHKWHGVQYGENTELCHCNRLKHGRC